MSERYEPVDADVIDRLTAAVQAAPAEVRELGRVWYDGARWECERMGEDFARPPYAVAGIVAALSPRQTWARNLVVAAEVLAGHTPSGVFRGQLLKAWRIDEGEHPETALRGPKTSSFWRSIMGGRTTADVCIDGWMLGAIAGCKPEQPHYNWLARKGQYARAQRIIGAVAERIGEDPVTTQAIVWVIVRGAAS